MSAFYGIVEKKDFRVIFFVHCPSSSTRENIHAIVEKYIYKVISRVRKITFITVGLSLNIF